MGREFAIGDIHGCVNTLENLLTAIKLNKNDSIYFLGDYIDRGMHSKLVIDNILNLKNKGYNITCLKGNHEQMFIESESDDDYYLHWLNFCGGKQTLQSFGIVNYSELEKKYINFFKTLQYYAQLGEYIFVHAGLNFNNQDLFEDKNAMLWSRPFTIQINYKFLGNQYVIHGHTPQSKNDTLIQLKNIETTRMVNIDNGCVFKDFSDLGRLTALQIGINKLTSIQNSD